MTTKPNKMQINAYLDFMIKIALNRPYVDTVKLVALRSTSGHAIVTAAFMNISEALRLLYKKRFEMLEKNNIPALPVAPMLFLSSKEKFLEHKPS